MKTLKDFQLHEDRVCLHSIRSRRIQMLKIEQIPIWAQSKTSLVIKTKKI